MGKKRTKEEWSAIMAKYNKSQDDIKSWHIKRANDFGKEHQYDQNRFPLRNREAVPKGHFIHNPRGADSAGALRLAKFYNQKASTFANKQKLAQLDYDKHVKNTPELYFENPEYKELEKQLYASFGGGDEGKENELRRKVRDFEFDWNMKNRKHKESKAKAGRQFSIYQTHSNNNQTKVDQIMRAKSRYDNYPDKGFEKSDLKKIKGFVIDYSKKTNDAQKPVHEYYDKSQKNRDAWSEYHNGYYRNLSKERGLHSDDENWKPKYEDEYDDPEFIKRKKLFEDTEKKLIKEYKYDEYTKNLDNEKIMRKELGFTHYG